MSSRSALKNGVHLYPFRMDYLTEEMVAKAEKELNETERTRTVALREFRELLKSEQNLTCPEDDAYLIQYLRARKFHVNKAFSLLQNYYGVKKNFPELFSSVDWHGIRTILKEKALNLLPHREEDGCVYLVIKVGNWNPENIVLGQLIHSATIAVLIALKYPPTQVNGLKIIIDAKGLNVKHLAQFTPRYLCLLASGLRNALPCRFKAIHILNEAFLFQYIWKIFKMFVSEKIKKRFFFHGNKVEGLARIIPKEILAREYGGEYENSDDAWLLQEIDDLKELLEYYFRCSYK